MAYTTYIFDMDGTILNTIEDLTDATNYAMKAMGYPIHTSDEVKGFVGNGIRKLIERAVPAGTDETGIIKTHEFFTEYYKAHCQDKTVPYDGIIELLQELKKRGKKLAVVSNKAHYAVKELADNMFLGLFDVALGEKDGVNKKPARDMVDIVLSELNESTENAVYIGDTDVDFNTAKNSEMDCILVTWGFRGEEFLAQFPAKYTVDKPEEILDDRMAYSK